MPFDRNGFYRQVGLRLARRRHELRLTQEQVASGIGMPRATYANIEAGRQGILTDVVWRAAVILETSVAALLPEPLPDQAGQQSELFMPVNPSTSVSTGPTMVPGILDLVRQHS